MADDVTLLPLGGEGEALQASFEAYRNAVNVCIADLKAQLAEARDWSSTLADAADDLRAELREAELRIAELGAELAELKERRCETCKSWRGAIDADGWRTCKSLHTPMPPDARCDKWQGEET